MPSPYRIPLFNEIHEQYEKKGWKLVVIFLTRTYSKRKWNVHEKEFKFNFHYLEGIRWVYGEALLSLSLSLPFLLYRERPSAVIVGGFSFAAVWTYFYTHLFDVPFIIWSGETTQQETKRKDFLSLRRVLRKYLVQKTTTAIAYGTEAKKYLAGLGIRSQLIHTAINTVDVKFYKEKTQLIKEQKERLKAEKGWGKINILYVGHLTVLKGIEQLLTAFSRIKKNDVALHLIGEGPYEETLKKKTQYLNLQNVHFWGFKQKEELPLFYGLSDIFVFPSYYDIWGLVCIEAMSAQLPVMSSIYAGVTSDLIENGLNGFYFNPDDIDDFANKLRLLICDDNLRNTMAANALHTVDNRFAITKSALTFIQIIEIYIR